MDAWTALMRCSWCGPPRGPLLLPPWSGSRSTHGASYFCQRRSKRHILSSSSLMRSARWARKWTFLRPGMFAANALTWWAPQIRAGKDVVRWPHVAAPTAPIHERDIAAVAVRALCEDGHAGAEYVLTGPESMSQFEQVRTIGRVIGRSLRMEEISPDEARRELLALMPAFVVNMLLDAWAAAIGQPALVTSTVREITGTPARTFLEWATGHAAEFGV